jgi:thiamine-phosphate pyrophosphorylase
MKLIVISNPTNLNNEHEITCSLFDAGLKYFHLRKPDFSKNEMDNFLKQMPEKYFDRIVLHSHFELQEKYNLKGIHTKPHLQKTTLNEISISASFHSFKEIEECKEKYDYFFLSPIFNSISKENYKAAFDRSELKCFLDHNKERNIIALGGMDEHTIPDAIESGFNGVAVLGALWMSTDPLQKFLRLKNCFKTEMK